MSSNLDEPGPMVKSRSVSYVIFPIDVDADSISSALVATRCHFKATSIRPIFHLCSVDMIDSIRSKKRLFSVFKLESIEHQVKEKEH